MEETTGLLLDPAEDGGSDKKSEDAAPLASEKSEQGRSEAEPEREDVMAKFTVKDGAGSVQHNGKTYGSGDKIEMMESEAIKIAHALREGDDLKAKLAKG